MSWGNHLPKIIVLSLVVILVLNQWYTGGIQPSEYDFEDAFNAIHELDVLYNTEFRNESHKSEYMNRRQIESYLEDLELLRENMVNNTIVEEQEYVVNFFDARKNMLLSLDAFQKALSLGSRGVFSGVENCDNQQDLRLGIEWYNESRRLGARAFRDLDMTLRLKSARPLIGIGSENRPKFYSSAVQEMGDVVNYNNQAIEEFCPVYLEQKANRKQTF